ncbi:GNAT family N-acetyltransferase [Eggerthella timonensis]|uniref:GNAT family N-acetyltransferase n=1 Tax=Eggerthella timonensis TaxID=1871008 RepID=UPI000C77CE29|nr:GNAT family N-acetyltransferase [Eggerthella timonensis]
MNLSGLITVQPDQTEELDALATMVGTCFLEEMWYVTWLEALDELGIGTERKLEITRAVIRSDYAVTAPFQCVYTLPDRAGAANVYLRSELGDIDWTELEEESGALLAEMLTDEEIAVLGPRIEAMDPISSTSWPLERTAPDEDFVYFISAAVDPEKRGTGAFRRLFTPFLAYADEHGLDCYLDCYTDRLEQLYGHFGFETVERRSIEAFPIEERLMIRRPQ